MTVGFCIELGAKGDGPVQAKVALGVDEVPIIVADGMLQFNSVPVLPTLGAVVLPVTVTEDVLVQPLEPPVTVTV